MRITLIILMLASVCFFLFFFGHGAESSKKRTLTSYLREMSNRILKLEMEQIKLKSRLRLFAGFRRPINSLKSLGGYMVWIPSGKFLMGSPVDDPERFWKEGTPQQVKLHYDFWMMQFEVTQTQYKALIGNNPSHFKYFANFPVEGVSWHQAAMFANKLSEKESLPKCFSCKGGQCQGVGNQRSDYLRCRGWRLPTEAEWEYAARAGTETARYSDHVDMVGWHSDNRKIPNIKSPQTRPVGKKQPNGWGLYDMLGNVWEWCYDRYDIPNSQTRDNRTGAASGETRVVRGGSWNNPAKFMRSAARDGQKSNERHAHIGFRLVKSSLF